MKLIFAQESLPITDLDRPWIFLAGPTPRSRDVPTWRREAVSYFAQFEFEGTLLIPEFREEQRVFDEDQDYDAQVDWEWDALDAADIIMFWVPRDLDTLPGFTTNVEFGLYATSGKVVFGAPENAHKNKYLWRIAERYDMNTSGSLRWTVWAAAWAAIHSRESQ